MEANEAHYYEVGVNWSEARKGTLASPELDQTIEVATPPEFPGGIPGVWSPEHLLVAAVNSCLMTTFLSIAENSKLQYRHFSSKAVGKLEKVEGKFMISEIVLQPLLEVMREEDVERALRVLNKAEANCLISNSVRSKIVFEPKAFAPKEQQV